MERVQLGLRAAQPTRFTFDAAAEHIYMLLLKKDCYPRFIRSEHYKALLVTGVQPPHKKRFFGFGVPKKKSSTTAQPAAGGSGGGVGGGGLLSGITGGSSGGGVGASGGVGSSVGAGVVGSLTRRRGSDRSLSGSAHELAVSGKRGVMHGSASRSGDGDVGKVSQSHSQSNLSDIAYR